MGIVFCHSLGGVQHTAAMAGFRRELGRFWWVSWLPWALLDRHFLRVYPAFPALKPKAPAANSRAVPFEVGWISSAGHFVILRPVAAGPRDMRHAAVKLDGNVLRIFYSNVHDCPEHILTSTVELTPDWVSWTASEPVSVLAPEMDYEGADLALEPSSRGWAPKPVRQTRDPGIYREGDRTYLLYSVAGERGIAIAEITE